MSDTRRDFLRLAAVGAGSLATLGVTTKSGQACCWRSSGRAQARIISEPFVRDAKVMFPLPIDYSYIARTFTVYGTYSDFTGTPNIKCDLYNGGDVMQAPGSVTYQEGMTNSGTWMADFTVPDPPVGGTSGLKIIAKLLDSTGDLKDSHNATNLTLSMGSGTPTTPPITITSPGNRVAKDKIKKKAKPYGEIHEPAIAKVFVSYFYKGRDLVGPTEMQITGSDNDRKWKVKLVDGKDYIDLKDHGDKQGVSCHLEARLANGTSKYLVSDHTNAIEA